MKTAVWNTFRIFVKLSFLTYSFSDDTVTSGSQNSMNGLIDPQTDEQTLNELKQNSGFSKRLFYPDGDVLYTNITKNSNDNVFVSLAPSNQGITIVVTPCLDPITWRVFHRYTESSMELPADVPSLVPEDRLLYEYTGNVQNFSFDYDQGLHYVQVLSNETTAVWIHASIQMEGESLLQVSEFGAKNKIKVEKKIGDSPHVRLILPEIPELPPDSYIDYCLIFVISKKRHYSSICNVQALHPDKSGYIDQRNHCDNLQDDSELKVCREESRITEVDLKLEPNSSYYVSIFAWDINGFSVLFANLFFKFKNTPLRLFDGKPERKSMSVNNGKISFKYKVRKQNVTANSKLFFYVLPCGRSDLLDVEIKHKKRVIMKKRINAYQRFEIPDPGANRRYVIKIKNVFPKTVDTCDLIEVMATMRPKAFPLPPKRSSDLRVNATAICPGGRSGRNDRVAAEISWLPVDTDDVLDYCVYVFENPTNRTADIFNSTDIFYPLMGEKSSIHGCWRSRESYSEKPLFSKKIRRFKVHMNYSIQVVVSKAGRTQQYLPYDLLNVQFERPANCRNNRSTKNPSNFEVQSGHLTDYQNG